MTNHDRYEVSAAEVRDFTEQGFLVVPQLVAPDEVRELRDHTEEVISGDLVIPGRIEPPAPDATPEQVRQHHVRIHQLHFVHELHERYLLHPRVLDVLEVLIGPDVMAMQTMLFLKAPGQVGQGYHQDSYYIQTLPDTLCGAWIAIDDADEENGCVSFVTGTQYEPVYRQAQNVSHDDTEVNDLARVTEKYPGREVHAVMKAGDVAFFAGKVMHRSLANRSKDRRRRAFVSHYANARSWTHWGAPVEECRNQNQILARGQTHLPHREPMFTAPVAGSDVDEEAAAG
ncbi:phytanoyl-CoA dioxygenase family protein [Candidatus Poribacteria bacterium]|nr:phytanoyl-CoA dioxygenase family protein [Candidatus Poribacteria bacterium]MBT5536453.1 phytanoyl-CoA dioxygenase family protein [Candidatus Poribacteria bacterium]MBT5713696.1 phytanoyl-CoA dioxygenase family protein [Candidatus Poribacteria bacterium]MBT7096764.1 phytanoyl-CoA dioxygenase family protein [Candidatus Poribacteria bacterium]MBT7806772.1 phytanoyl-CoA dioxygenase family protein [Candidatus Poribacteria bacterium]